MSTVARRSMENHPQPRQGGDRLIKTANACPRPLSRLEQGRLAVTLIATVGTLLRLSRLWEVILGEPCSMADFYRVFEPRV
jgi:hypothetical protein